MIDATPPSGHSARNASPTTTGRQYERHQHQGAGERDPGEPDPREEKRDRQPGRHGEHGRRRGLRDGEARQLPGFPVRDRGRDATGRESPADDRRHRPGEEHDQETDRHQGDQGKAGPARTYASINERHWPIHFSRPVHLVARQ
jgi:hypothetical protein